MRLLLRTRFLDDPLRALAGRHGVEAAIAPDTDTLLREAPNADALCLWPDFYDAALRDALAHAAPRMRWLQLVTMGYDKVEAHGAPRGVLVTNAGDAYAPTVAEHAVASALALLRRIPEAVRRAERRDWAQAAVAPSVGTLNGATVTVLGFGNIGRAVAERVRAFDARVVAVTRSGTPDPLAHETHAIGALHDVLSRTDALIVAVPLNGETRALVGAAALAALPAHAIVVNVARGAVIDQRALAAALRDGRLGGAALDVVDPEPLPADDPLWNAPNVLITPHVAGFGGAVPARRVVALIERNLQRFLAGDPLEARVPAREA
ncbi:MAG TPA: D-2-hydroxyacid dehydrogenase [Candidatus Baltobacteraceae bacterium]|nr:D-2-hydroxyacid dehydrogenase [Candidatus Baltobacteraceae bacterium]